MNANNKARSDHAWNWITAAEIVWVALTILILGLFFIGTPAEYQSHLETAARLYTPSLAQLGLSIHFYALYRTAMDIFLVVAFVAISGIIFLRKSKDWMALLASIASMTFGTLFVPTLIQLVELQPAWRLPVSFVRAIGLGSSIIVFYYLFPDGRFTPRWTRWLAIVWGFLALIWFLFPEAPFNLVHLETWLKNLAPSFAVLFFWALIGVAAQVYRYFRVSNALQRQQTKWVVFGTSAAVIGFALYYLPLILLPSFNQPGVLRLLHIFLGVPLYHFFILLAPITIGISILRYRLWDIDLLINRSLVYGIFSGSIVLLYFGAVLLFQEIFLLVTGVRSNLAVVASTLAIAALFNPLRKWIQDAINRRFFPEKYYAVKALAALSSTLRDEVDLSRLTERLESVVWDMMQPAHILSWLRLPSGFSTHTFLHEQGPDIRIIAEIPFVDPLVAYLGSASEAISINDLDLDSPALRRFKSANVKIVVPLISQGELTGWLSLGPRLNKREYSLEDRELLTTLAHQAAPAVRVAQMVYQQRLLVLERERLDHELQVARLVQQLLLPKEMPAFFGWETCAHYQPAKAVGGDFYDFLQFKDGRLGVIIGDVTDKGVPAALLMATARNIIRSVACQTISPGQVLERVNNLLEPDVPDLMFVTCLYAVIDQVSGRVQYANAGHNLPYHRNKEGVTELWATGMPLGLMPDMYYEEKETVIHPGECLLFYSDGLVEAHNPKGEMFGGRRLKELMRANSDNPDFIDFLLGELREFTGPGWDQEDDVTLVLLRRT